MQPRIARLLRLALTASLATAPFANAQDRVKSQVTAPSKKVLVELFTSQGCNSCPSANEFLGQFDRLGYGPNQVVPISFHVDYFNKPWADPYSNNDYSRREAAYNDVLKRKDLYFTPMMMVDGRTPMLGSNRPEALKAIKKSLAEAPGASIRLTIAGKDVDRTAKVEVYPIGAEVVGRSLMIGLVLTEGPITTRVPSGENAGSALVEPAVVRSFAFKQAKLEASTSSTFTFPIKPPGDAVAAKCRVAAFVQDWDNGKVYQAELVPLVEAATARR